MYKNIIKITTLSIVGYLIYQKVNKRLRNFVKVEDVKAIDIIKMLKDLDFQILLGFNEKVVHFIKEDKTEAIVARLDADDEVYLIEYYFDDGTESKLESVYPAKVRLDNVSAQKARSQYLRLLGSIGTIERRFASLIKEIVDDAALADLTI